MSKTKLTDKEITRRMEKLAEIKQEMLELVERARVAVRGTDEEDRARSYWLAHITTALDDNHTYVGGSMCTLQDTIESLEASLYEDEE